MKKAFFTALAILSASFFFTSCDPDDIDAFAWGYRQGYYGTRSADDTPDGMTETDQDQDVQGQDVQE